MEGGCVARRTPHPIIKAFNKISMQLEVAVGNGCKFRNKASCEWGGGGGAQREDLRRNGQVEDRPELCLPSGTLERALAAGAAPPKGCRPDSCVTAAAQAA